LPFVGLALIPIHNSHFCKIRFKKSEFLSMKLTAYTPRCQSIPVKAKSLLVKLNQLGKVRLVISRNKKGGYIFIVTGHIRLPMVEDIRKYDKRW
jgi:hypothetical protein